MKKILLFAFTICCLSDVFAQQVPLYSQYFDNPFVYNPAYAGLDRFGSVNLSHRIQWQDIDGAPVTTLASVDIPVYDFSSGVGFRIMRDAIGPYQNYKLTSSYAYHRIGRYVDSSILSFGVSLGYNHSRTDFSGLYIRHEGDSKIDNIEGAYNGFELSVGMNYMFKDKFQIGIAIPQMISTGIRAVDNAEYNLALTRHYLISLKCTLKSYDELHYVEPQAMLRYVEGLPFQFDAGMQYTYNQTFWVNAMYRSNFSALFALGFKLHRYRLGIARDFAIGELAGAAGGTTEFVFGYKFAHLGRYKYPSPAGRNSKIRFKKRHPSIPGPLNKKLYMGSPKKFKGRRN